MLASLLLRLGQVGLEGRICEDLLEAHRSCGSRHIFQLLLSHHHSLILRRLGRRGSWIHRCYCGIADLGRLLAGKIQCCACAETLQEGLIHVGGNAHIIVTAGGLPLVASSLVV